MQVVGINVGKVETAESWNGGMAEWQNGGMAERSNGGLTERRNWQSDLFWQNGGMAERQLHTEST